MELARRAGVPVLIDGAHAPGQIPLDLDAATELSPGDAKALQDELHHRHRIEVPVHELAGRRLLRVSAQLYNSEDDIDRLVAALSALL